MECRIHYNFQRVWCASIILSCILSSLYKPLVPHCKVHYLHVILYMYLCISLFSLQARYLFEPQLLWMNYPHSDMPLSLKFYMLVQV